ADKGGTPTNLTDVLGPSKVPGAPAPDIEDEEEGKGKRPRAVAGREQRHVDRAERQKARKRGTGEEGGGVGLVAPEEDRRGPTPRRPGKPKKEKGPQPRKGKVPVQAPITVRALSEAIGKPAVELLFKLRDHGVQASNLNVTLDPDVAAAIALDYGV